MIGRWGSFVEVRCWQCPNSGRVGKGGLGKENLKKKGYLGEEGGLREEDLEGVKRKDLMKEGGQD